MGLGLAFTLIMAIGMLLAVLLTPKGRFLIHIGWWILGLMVIFGFMISAVLTLFLVIFNDFCNWFEGIFSATDGGVKFRESFKNMDPKSRDNFV